jgi:hypothetical protein
MAGTARKRKSKLESNRLPLNLLQLYMREQQRRRPLDEELIFRVIERLKILRQETDPSVGSASAASIDAKAESAIALCGVLIAALADWAMFQLISSKLGKDIGTKLRGLAEGAYGDGDERTRAALRALLAPLFVNRAFTHQLSHLLTEALESLDTGEVRPLLTPTKTFSKGAVLSLARSRLRAVEHWAFRCGAGLSRERAADEVAKTYGVSVDTLKTWRQRDLPKRFADLVPVWRRAKEDGKFWSRLSSAEQISEIESAGHYRAWELHAELKKDGEKYRAVCRKPKRHRSTP